MFCQLLCLDVFGEHSLESSLKELANVMRAVILRAASVAWCPAWVSATNFIGAKIVPLVAPRSWPKINISNAHGWASHGVALAWPVSPPIQLQVLIWPCRSEASLCLAVALPCPPCLVPWNWISVLHLLSQAMVGLGDVWWAQKVNSCHTKLQPKDGVSHGTVTSESLAFITPSALGSCNLRSCQA